MKNNSEHSTLGPCEYFLDSLDIWLAHELNKDESLAMQAHHNSCADCQLETLLARRVETITRELPEFTRPQIRAVEKNGDLFALSSEGFFSRLFASWRQPLVFVPACALVLTSLLVINLSKPDSGLVEPQVFVVNGQEYTQEEIIKAVEDLEIALKYVSKYSSYPAQVVRAEIKQSHLPLPPQEDMPDSAI